MTINEETNINSKRHKKYSSSIPMTNINHELIEKKNFKEKKNLNKDKNNIDDIKDKLTNSSNLIKEEGKNNINNNNKINNII
jgi:hypothetical protein